MSTEKAKELNNQFVKFANQKKILICDTSQTSRTSVSNILTSMGVKQAHMFLAAKMEIAEETILTQKPGIIITDYELGKKCGLDLLQKIRATNPELKESIFVILTGNTSQSAVAKSAEEDVDAFIIKPFTPEILRNSILKAAITKINPPMYLKLIESGKNKISEGKIDEALGDFQEACKHDDKPSLALAYIGQVNAIKKMMEEATGKYEEGLKFNRIHYKCLAGLFDVFMEQKKHKDAYDVVKKIAQYFPANPQRLSAVLRLAIINNKFEDIEKYYQTFLTIDERDTEMIKYVCAALVITGKYYLQRNTQARALELFQKAAATGSGRPKVLKEIVISLVDAKLDKPAAEYLKKFPPETQKGPEFGVSQLLISEKTSNPGLVIEMAKKLLNAGVKDALIYKVLIRTQVSVGHKDAAENTLQQAQKDFPNEAFTLEIKEGAKEVKSA